MIDTPERKIRNPRLFRCCLRAAAANDDLVAEFDRLRGYNLSLKGPAIVTEIDRATGYLEEGARAFYEFVYAAIYLRVLASEEAEAPPAVGGSRTDPAAP
jgi:hypothetical protein